MINRLILRDARPFQTRFIALQLIYQGIGIGGELPLANSETVMIATYARLNHIHWT
jgi:hypothetical protein